VSGTAADRAWNGSGAIALLLHTAGPQYAQSHCYRLPQLSLSAELRDQLK